MNSIDKLGAQSVTRAYVHGSETAAAGPRPDKAHHQRSHATKADSVTLSDSAKSLAAAREAVQAAPEVRDEKIAQIKQRVEDGTYHVSSSVLARKIVEASKNPA
jgi:flagellar biosynthesis anti-sigma factor FlgM